MASSGSYTTSEILWGPGKLFFDVPAPAAGEGLTIDSEGYPLDGVGARVGNLAGYTKEGVTFVRSVEFFEIRADQLMRPVHRMVTQENAAMSGTLVQLANAISLAHLLPGSTNLVDVGAGHFGRTFGGNRFIRPEEATSVTYTFRNLTVTGGYSYLMIYRGYNWQEFSLHLRRTEPAEVDFRFEGDPDQARKVGDRSGRIYI